MHVTQMTYDSMMAFAERWIASWNRRDVEAVLAHFADDAEFISPIASTIVGRPVLRNKEELRAYWQTGMTRLSTIEFTLDHASWDERRRELNVVYDCNLNGDRKRACEVMCFDSSGRQVRGEALYGAPL
jgi:ketosteroid isomerase-like protein